MSTEGNFIYTGKKREKKIYNSGASPAMHVLGKRGERRGKEGKGGERRGKGGENNGVYIFLRKLRSYCLIAAVNFFYFLVAKNFVEDS